MRHKLHLLGHLAPLLRRELCHRDVEALDDHEQAIFLPLDETDRREGTPAKRSLVFVGIHRIASMGRGGRPAGARGFPERSDDLAEQAPEDW